MTKNNPKPHGRIVRLLPLIPFLFLLPLALYLYFNSTQISQTPSTVTPTKVVAKPSVKTATPNLSDTNLATYTSKKFGLSFVYPKKIEQESFTVREVGNKICIGSAKDDTNCTQSQFVEVFQKDPSESLEAAIKRTFLTGKDPQKCFVTLSDNPKLPGNLTQAIIDFPLEGEFDLEQMMQKTDYCSKDYAKTNGMRYFQADSNHPEKFLYFDIGQYGIPVSATETWQDTVVLN